MGIHYIPTDRNLCWLMNTTGVKVVKGQEKSKGRHRKEQKRSWDCTLGSFLCYLEKILASPRTAAGILFSGALSCRVDGVKSDLSAH